jgi:hypothetical protein
MPQAHHLLPTKPFLLLLQRISRDPIQTAKLDDVLAGKRCDTLIVLRRYAVRQSVLLGFLMNCCPEEIYRERAVEVFVVDRPFLLVDAVGVEDAQELKDFEVL